MKRYSDLSINYAFQKTITWGGRTWKLKEDDIAQIRELIDEDNPGITGKRVWQFFRSKFGKDFYTSRKFEKIGEDFLEYLKKF